MIIILIRIEEAIENRKNLKAGNYPEKKKKKKKRKGKAT